MDTSPRAGSRCYLGCPMGPRRPPNHPRRKPRPRTSAQPKVIPPQQPPRLVPILEAVSTNITSFTCDTQTSKITPSISCPLPESHASFSKFSKFNRPSITGALKFFKPIIAFFTTIGFFPRQPRRPAFGLKSYYYSIASILQLQSSASSSFGLHSHCTPTHDNLFAIIQYSRCSPASSAPHIILPPRLLPSSLHHILYSAISPSPAVLATLAIFPIYPSYYGYSSTTTAFICCSFVARSSTVRLFMPISVL